MERSYQFDRMEAKPVKGALVIPEPRRVKVQAGAQNTLPGKVDPEKRYRYWGKFDSSAPKRKKVTFSKQYKAEDKHTLINRGLVAIIDRLENEPKNENVLKILGRYVSWVHREAQNEKNYGKLGVAISYAQHEKSLEAALKCLEVVPDDWNNMMQVISEKVFLFLGVATKQLPSCLVRG